MTETSNKNYLIFLFQRWADSHVLNCFSSLIKKTRYLKWEVLIYVSCIDTADVREKTHPLKQPYQVQYLHVPSYLVPESFGDNRGKLYYQPKQCTIKGKSLKFTIDLHEVSSPQNGSLDNLPKHWVLEMAPYATSAASSAPGKGTEIPTNQKHLLTRWLGKMMFSNLKSLNVHGIFTYIYP